MKLIYSQFLYNRTNIHLTHQRLFWVREGVSCVAEFPLALLLIIHITMLDLYWTPIICLFLYSGLTCFLLYINNPTFNLLFVFNLLDVFSSLLHKQTIDVIFIPVAHCDASPNNGLFPY